MANYCSKPRVGVRAGLSPAFRQQPSLGKTLWAHAMVVGAVALTLYANDPGLTLVMGGSLIAPLFAWLAICEARRAPLILSPLSFYFFWNMVGLGLSPLYAAY